MHGWEKKPRLFLNLIDFENLEYDLKLKPLGDGSSTTGQSQQIFYGRNVPRE